MDILNINAKPLCQKVWSAKICYNCCGAFNLFYNYIFTNSSRLLFRVSFYYPILAKITFTILISAGKPIGGFLFGFIFLSASKNVDNRLLKEYLAIAGYRIMILFTSNQLVSLISLDYPPFWNSHDHISLVLDHTYHLLGSMLLLYPLHGIRT